MDNTKNETVRGVFMYGQIDDTVNIPETEYRELLDRSEKLAALEAGGVDNWEWYDEAMSSLD